MDYMDYPDLDPDEPRRIEIMNADGTVFREIWASITFCVTYLGVLDLPPDVYPAEGAWWRVKDYVPPQAGE